MVPRFALIDLIPERGIEIGAHESIPAYSLVNRKTFVEPRSSWKGGCVAEIAANPEADIPQVPLALLLSTASGSIFPEAAAIVNMIANPTKPSIIFRIENRSMGEISDEPAGLRAGRRRSGREPEQARDLPARVECQLLLMERAHRGVGRDREDVLARGQLAEPKATRVAGLDRSRYTDRPWLRISE